MSHWHECKVCKEYFECVCDASSRLAACCEECSQLRREKLLADSVALGLLHIMAE